MSRDPDFDFSAAGLGSALELLAEHLGGREHPPSAGLAEDLPEDGLGGEAALRRLATSALAGARSLREPGFLAHMDPPTPWPAWAGALWAAALNQNLLHPETAPAARALEHRVVGWLAPYFGMAGGHMLPGASVANLTAIWAARELRGVTEVVASEAAHLSVPKAAHLLGLRHRAVPVDSRQRLRPDALGDLSRSALVLTAGTVVAGAVDPLEVGRGAAWRHVDAAWAGPLRLTDRHPGVLAGVEEADSVTISAHKWLFQPKESGVVMFADPEAAHGAISFGGTYLAAPNVGVLGSHGAAALPLAATLLAWGRSGMAKRIERCMDIAAELAALVEAEERLELWAPPVTGVVLWLPREGDADAVRARLTGAFVSAAEVAGERWLRSVSANPMAEPRLVVERVLAAL